VLEVKAILIIIKSVAFEKERLVIFERVIYLYKEQNIFVFVILKRGFFATVCHERVFIFHSLD
jgi:hypothetical protein